MATRVDPQGLQPSVPPDASDHVARSLRCHVLCGLSRVWAAIAGHDGVLRRRLSVVRVLSLPLCAARCSVHHAVAEAGWLLRSKMGLGSVAAVGGLVGLGLLYWRERAKE